MVGGLRFDYSNIVEKLRRGCLLKGNLFSLRKTGLVKTGIRTFI